VSSVPYFFDQTPRLLFFLLFVSVWLLFKGGYYSREVFISFGATDCAAKVPGQ